MAGVLELIDRHEAKLSQRQGLIAEVIREQPHECAMWSIQVLAEKAGVSEATVLRFARLLGFSGYPELKSSLQHRVIENLSSWRRVERTLTTMPSESSVMQEFVGNQIRYMQAMLEQIPNDQVERFSEILSHARRVYLFGEGAATTPVHALQFWLRRFGLDISPIVHTGRRLLDQIVHAEAKDVLVLFVFGRESKEATTLIDWMQYKAASCLLITDIPSEQLSPGVDSVIRFERGPVSDFHSMALPVALVDAIALQCARILGPRAVEAVRVLEEARTRYGLS